MSVPRGTTPTFYLTFSEEELDLTTASNVYVTFKQNEKRITKSGADLVIAEKQIDVYLSQKDTLGFKAGEIEVQANWTSNTLDSSGKPKRGSSEVVTVELSKQLLERILE